MIQPMSYKEKYDMYNLLEKDVLIGMLIEIDKIKPIEVMPEIVSGSCGWFQCSNTVGRCDKCGKQQWEH